MEENEPRDGWKCLTKTSGRGFALATGGWQRHRQHVFNWACHHPREHSQETHSAGMMPTNSCRRVSTALAKKVVWSGVPGRPDRCCVILVTLGFSVVCGKTVNNYIYVFLLLNVTDDVYLELSAHI